MIAFCYRDALHLLDHPLLDDRVRIAFGRVLLDELGINEVGGEHPLDDVKQPILQKRAQKGGGRP